MFKMKCLECFTGEFAKMHSESQEACSMLLILLDAPQMCLPLNAVGHSSRVSAYRHNCKTV